MKLFKPTLILLFLLITSQTYSQVESIKNGILWRDTDGNRIKAHGVSIMKHQGVYYMLGEDRSDAFTFEGVNLYSSTDLMNWQFRNTIIDEGTNSDLTAHLRITERPCLIYNALTNRFVVWLKYQNGSYTNNKAAIFYSNTIDGDYTYDREFFPAGYDSNDSSLFVDTDGKAYYISTNKANGSLNLYTLTDDYMDAADATILFPGENREAPVIFKKDNLYYMICSNKTGWDPNQMRYSTSTSLKSGWAEWKLVGNRINFDSQPTDVITITGTAGTNYYYVGDRWKDPNIRESKTVIFPLNVANGNLNITNVNEFKIDLVTSAWTVFDDNTYVPQNNWSLVSVSSQETAAANASATNAFDGNINTIWHSRYSSGQDAHPHEMVVNLGSSYNVSGFMYIPRQDVSVNGVLRDFQLFLSTDGVNWGAPVASGWLSYLSEIYFQQKTSSYMKFVSRSDFNDTRFAAASEFRLMTNSDYELNGINSYYNADNSGWRTGTNIEVNAGSQIQFGPQARFSGGGQTAFYGSFSWHGPNNFYSNERSPVLSNIQAENLGEYTVFYLDDKFNVQKQSINVFSNSLSTEDNFSQKVNYLYPNPASNIINIHDSSEDTSYTLYDFSGKEIIKGKGKKIDVSILSAGYYFVMINSNAYKFIKK